MSEQHHPTVQPTRDLVVQRTLFSGPYAWVNSDLYAAVERGVVRRHRHHIELHQDSQVSTNTYFGRFEASYWQRWTELTAVSVRLEIESAGRVEVSVRASDIGSHVRTMAVTSHEGDGMVVIDVPVAAFCDGGAMWLNIAAFDAPARVGAVTWSVETDRPVRRASVAICTFNRADDCAATVAALASDELVSEVIDDVYVTDQGTDTVDIRPEFIGASEVFGTRLHYLQQSNLGGAGGFSRGMFEAVSTDGEGDSVDVLLMDDDIRVEPETVLRIFAFAALTRTPTLVGAQMLYLFNPDYLLASAERSDLGTLQGGLDADPWALRDASVVEEVQERRIDAEYNAWWSCLVPSEVVQHVGLPLPLFFQWDDIEFGIRARQAGFPTATLAGAAVWHADFYWKDGDDFSQYFAQRNSLITASVRGGFTTRAMAKNLARSVLRPIVSMQYGLAQTRLAGIEAFLDGPEVLRDGGATALTNIRSVRQEFPETVKLPVSALPAEIMVVRAEGEPRKDREDAVLAKRLLWQLTGRSIDQPVAVSYEDAAWWHVSLFTQAWVTDASQTGVRKRVLDKAKARTTSRRMRALLLRFVREGDSAQQQWQSAFPELTSRENWARLYGLSQ